MGKMILDRKSAMCGCCCDLCKAYAPNVQKNDQRKTLAEMWNKYYGLDPSVMDCSDFPCGVFYKRCGSFPEEKKDFDMDEYNEYILAYDNETRIREYKSKREQLEKYRGGSAGDFSNV